MKRIHLMLLAAVACFFMPIVSTRAGGAASLTRAGVPTATFTGDTAATFNGRVISPDPGTPAAARDNDPAAANDVVKDACREAAASHKKVLILFHAS